MEGLAYQLGRIFGYILIILGTYALIKKLTEFIATKRPKQKTYNTYINEQHTTYNINTDYKKAYEPKYLMTLNEKEQFKKIQTWAQQKGYIVFTKVRLLDLITPRKNQDNFKGRLWKIQAKHVDFVICDQSIKVKAIIEINDNSHKQEDRINRDNFVVEVLEACGYKVIQSYNIQEHELDQIQ